MIKNLPPSSEELFPTHIQITEPSPWVSRFIPLIPQDGLVLDLAAGGGRHGRQLMKQGCRAVFVDRQTDALMDLYEIDNAKVISADLEDRNDPFGTEGPLYTMTFDAIIVVNYLYRPLMASLINALAPSGVFLYETFARGNEEFARPRNPDHLLLSGELLDAVRGKLQVIAYEHGRVTHSDIPGVKQRICAINDLHISTRQDGNPAAHSLFT